LSFTVAGQTFIPETTQSHANDQLNYINGLLQNLGLPTLSPTNDNALWWTLLAAGNLQQVYDQALIQAAQSLNPALCDDNQILNLLPLTGTSLIPASPTTLTVVATANGNGNCVIPTGTGFSVGGVAYSITSGISLVPSGFGYLPAQCNSNGPNVLLSGAVTATSLTGTPPQNLLSFTNLTSAIPGRYQETPSQVRNRILSQAQFTSPWDQCQAALNSLPGVTLASVFFNPSLTNPVILSGAVSVPPRNAYIVLAGSSQQIASTYWSYMFSPTSGANYQNYTTLSGQVLPVYWDSPQSQVVYVQVYVDANKSLGSGYQSEIDNLLLGLNGTNLPGQSVSSEQVLSQISMAQQSTVVGALVSLNPVSGYYAKVTPSPNTVLFFSSSSSVTTFVLQ
jgi:hypothetical protein